MKRVYEESFGIIPLVYDGGAWKVLLILHLEGGHWAFPKGHKDGEEAPLQAAIRELKEETGLDVEKILRDEPLVEKYHFHRNNKEILKAVSYYPALVKGVLDLQKEEIQDAKWVLFDEVTNHLTFSEAKKICEALKNILSELLY